MAHTYSLHRIAHTVNCIPKNLFSMINEGMLNPMLDQSFLMVDLPAIKTHLVQAMSPRSQNFLEAVP